MNRIMTVGDLRKELEGVSDDLVLVYQSNVQGEEDEEGETTNTVAVGHVFSVFARDGLSNEFVIDGAQDNSEMY